MERQMGVSQVSWTPLHIGERCLTENQKSALAVLPGRLDYFSPPYGANVRAGAIGRG